MLDPLVSIIMAVYNGESYINQAVDSVLNQRYDNWELIIINDGSIDRTEKIIKSYSDRRIKYLAQNNYGIGKARNAGLEVLKGDFFCFLDADDLLPPESLESRLKIFRRNGRATFVDGRVAYYDQNLKKIFREWIPAYRGNPFNELVSQSGKCFFGNTWMIKRDPHIPYRFEEELSHCEDLLFYMRICNHDSFYDYTDDVILNYRRGHHSAMQNVSGLEKGYIRIYEFLKGQKNLSKTLLDTYRKKTRLIILKSYIGRMKIIDGLKAYNKSW